MSKISADYVAGFMENLGCFTFKKMRGKIYPCFIVRTNDENKIVIIDEIFLWLHKNINLKYFRYAYLQETVWTVANRPDLLLLIDFFNKNLMGTKKNQKDIVKFVQKYEKEHEIKNNKFIKI